MKVEQSELIPQKFAANLEFLEQKLRNWWYIARIWWKSFNSSLQKLQNVSV